MPANLLCPSVTPPDSREAGELEYWLERAAQLGQPILTLATREDADAPLRYAGTSLFFRAVILEVLREPK